MQLWLGQGQQHCCCRSPLIEKKEIPLSVMGSLVTDTTTLPLSPPQMYACM